ncbi:MAG: uroporphyrinogen-III C-methyltransferase [Burkholderiaceae bacterium]|jgi:uroporphyrin-3 C-methyltransferase|nr:uroporphyrinogen-III C-methyltransferase [Burkholderiaceae bacterium]
MTSEAPDTGPTYPRMSRLSWVAIGICLTALLVSGLLWQKLANIQEQLARQSADARQQATEARTIAKESQELVRETAARMAMSEARLSEVALQRSQLEELMQSLSRSRDENLVVDIESALRLALQQAQLAGSVEPILATLKSAELRVTRAAQPRLAPVQRAIAKDMARVKASTVSDTGNLLARLDELVRMADELPLSNAVGPQAGPAASGKSAASATPPSWWEAALSRAWAEARGLIRISHINTPEAALLAPEQAFFVRENLKLKLLNARLGLLARQLDSSRADLATASLLITRYFDASARRTQTAANLLLQVQSQMKTVELPRVDETLTALSTAASGR